MASGCLASAREVTLINITRVRQLHERALRVAQAYLGAEAELIEILQGMDETKGFRHYGAKSLFDYATTVLKLSTATTFNLTTVARKSREVPELKEAIRAGTLTLSKARKTVPVLTSANQAKWIGLAQTLTSRELEREVARARTEPFIQEQRRTEERRMTREYLEQDSHDPAGDESDFDGEAPSPKHELKFAVNRELMRKLERAKALLAHAHSKTVTLEETVEAALDLFLESKDPLWRKALNSKPAAEREKLARVGKRAAPIFVRAGSSRR